jgi:hypothetical protein
MLELYLTSNFVSDALTKSSSASTRAPGTPTSLLNKFSSVKLSARNSLSGISLKYSSFLFERTADESWEAPSPVIWLRRTSILVSDALTKSEHFDLLPQYRTDIAQDIVYFEHNITHSRLDYRTVQHTVSILSHLSCSELRGSAQIQNGPQLPFAELLFPPHPGCCHTHPIWSLTH